MKACIHLCCSQIVTIKFHMKSKKDQIGSKLAKICHKMSTFVSVCPSLCQIDNFKLLLLELLITSGKNLQNSVKKKCNSTYAFMSHNFVLNAKNLNIQPLIHTACWKIYVNCVRENKIWTIKSTSGH